MCRLCYRSSLIVDCCTMAFKVQQSVTVSGRPLKHKVSLTHIKVEEGKTFFRLSKQDPAIVMMMSLPRLDEEGQRIMARTSVFEMISDARARKYHELAAVESGDAPEAALTFMDGQPNKQRVSRARQAMMPSTVTITTPTVGPVDGVLADVVMGHGNTPLYIELTAEVVSYLVSAVQYQVANMGIKRSRKSKSISEVGESAGSVSSIVATRKRRHHRPQHVARSGSRSPRAAVSSPTSCTRPRMGRRSRSRPRRASTACASTFALSRTMAIALSSPLGEWRPSHSPLSVSGPVPSNIVCDNYRGSSPQCVAIVGAKTKSVLDCDCRWIGVIVNCKYVAHC